MATKDLLRSDGVQNFIHPLLAPISEPEVVINYLSRPLKAKVARTGYEAYLDNTGTGTGYAIKSMTFSQSDGSRVSYRFKFKGTSIYYKEIGSAGSTWTLLDDLPSDPGGIHTVPYVNTLFVFSTNGANALHYIELVSDVLTLTQETASEVPTNPTCGAVYANALFTNDSDVPYRMKRSAIGYGTAPDLGSPVVPFNGSQWTQNDNDPATARFYDVDPYTNGIIVGLHEINNRMVIFTGSDTGQMGMHRYDFNSLVKIPTKSSIRPDGQKTIHISEDGSAHFANNYGIYNFRGDRPRKISNALGDDGKNITPGAAIEFEELYMLALDASVTIERDGFKQTLTNPVIVRDMIADEMVWWNTAHRMVGFDVSADSATAQPMLYSIDSDGNTYKWNNNNTDAGEPIYGVLKFRPFYGNSVIKPLNLTELYAVCSNPGGQKIRVKLDNDDRYTTENTLERPLQQMQLPQTGNAHSLSVMVTCSTTGDRPDFYGYAYDYIQEKEPNGSAIR